MKVFFFNSLNPVPGKYLLFPEQRHSPFMPLPPLGLLALSASVKASGDHQTRIIDLNHEALYSNYPATGYLSRLYDSIKEKYLSAILREEPFLAGFQTLCNSHHFSVYLSRRLKQDYPLSFVLFGGPHASAVARQTIEAFPHVDAVLCGEADTSLPLLLDSLTTAGDLHAVPGLYYRENQELRCSGEPSLPVSLDSLPLPDYASYPYPVETAYIEAGRGCPYQCTFCSTSAFFSRNCRYKSAKRLLVEAEELRKAAVPMSKIHLIHDNFLGDRVTALQLCDSLAELQPAHRLDWGCSARADSLAVPGTIAALKRAGCRAVFIGVESGAASVQRKVRKNCDIHSIYTAFDGLREAGLEATCSFMCEFPEETPAELEETLRLCAFCSLSGVRFQLNPLILLPGTEAYRKYGNRLYLDKESHNREYDPSSLTSAETAEIISKSTAMFSVFCSVPLSHPELKNLSDIAVFLLNFFPYTILALCFWSSDFKGIHDICVRLKVEDDNSPAILYERFTKLIGKSANAHSSIQSLFRFECSCWDAIMEHTSERTHAENASSNSGFALAGQVRWGIFDVTPEYVRQSFLLALRTGEFPSPPKKAAGLYVLKAKSDRVKGTYKITVSKCSQVLLPLLDRLAKESQTAGELYDAVKGNFSEAECGAWLIRFIERGYIVAAGAGVQE